MMSDIFVYAEHFQGRISDITYIGLAQAQSIAKAKGSKVVAVLLGYGVKSLAADLLADEILVVDHESLKDFSPDEYAEVLGSIIHERKPELVIFGDTSIGSDLTGALSVKLDLPLVSFCKEIKVEGGKTRFVSQICGGKILVEGELQQGTSLVMLLSGKFKVEEGKSSSPLKISILDLPELPASRIHLKEFLLPLDEDVDISKEKILVAIGRGIENEDNVELAQELADALGGTLCASRPVIDRGYLPTSRLVGKSGKSVKPKLYLALGISGAQEHVEAIEDSDMIIAVNTDENAPIFNIAKYGITEDLLDVSEELIRSLQEAKGA
jgi:electron transfer flavoprotein alpha subunit